MSYLGTSALGSSIMSDEVEEERTYCCFCPTSIFSNPTTYQPRTLIFNSKGCYEDPVKREETKFESNKIRTSHYTWLTFLPLNLFEQIIRPANTYFMFIAILQSIHVISISNGTPTMLMPLCIVFIVTGIKDIIEDYKRHEYDNKENQREYEKINTNGDVNVVKSEELKVGDIVRVKDGQRFPSDILVIGSALGNKVPYVYVETSNIDGETNLKLKQVPEGLSTIESFNTDTPDVNNKYIKINDKTFYEFKKRMKNSQIDCDSPDMHLDQWHGMLKFIKIPTNNDINLNINNNNDYNDDIGGDHIDLSINKYETKNIALNFENLCLRGSELRNSDWVYGLVIYTGFDCKIFMNNKSRKAQRIKRSTVEKTLNWYILYMTMMQIIVCVFCAIASTVWFKRNGDAWYLKNTLSPHIAGLFKFFSWIIIFATFVPISLVVSMETVKYIQAFIIECDIKMYKLMNGKTDKFCKIQNSNLNEELGQIQYVFSDKTGTLTENSLDFRKCLIYDINYGTGQTEIGRAAKKREQELLIIEEAKKKGKKVNLRRKYKKGTKERKRNTKLEHEHVNFDELKKIKQQLYLSTLDDDSNTNNNDDDNNLIKTEHSVYVKRFLTVLAINNGCFPIHDMDGKLQLRASSPDDQCLTCFANYAGLQLNQRKSSELNIHFTPKYSDNEYVIHEDYIQLAEFEFTSKRKRMTVIVKNKKTNKIHCTMKGADSEMFKLIKDWNKHPKKNICEEYLYEYCEQGLRTLVIGEAIFNADWWENNWQKKYEKMLEKTLISDKREKGHIKGSCGNDCRKCELYNEIEKSAEIEYLGITAIEDKLQDSVPETISAMLQGGIRVWVLTGDKQSTAENIGIACNLLEPSMEKNGLLFRLVSNDINELETVINYSIVKIRTKQEGQQCGLVISSKALKIITKLNDERLLTKFFEITQECKSVLGVRLQPNQKSQILNFIRNRTGCVALGIGDGANDEPLIKTANIGVGIMGVEGTAAVRASDYSIAKFKFLQRLLFVHGRLNYKRNTLLILYTYYKNGLLSLSSFWFGLIGGWSGQLLFLEWAFQSFNIFFTAIPIMGVCVMDRDFDDKVLLANPRLYKIVQSRQLFNTKTFFTWIFESVVVSCVLTFLPILCYQITSPDHRGNSAGIWTTGVVIYTSIVFTSNFRLIFITQTWTWITHLIIWGSIFVYIMTMIVLNMSHKFEKAGSDYFFVVYRAFGSLRFYLTTFITTVIVLFIPFVLISFNKLRKQAYVVRNKYRRLE